MRAIILAAGRGERMRPLTDHCPKPLLQVQGEPLLVRLVRQLADAGITEMVINHAWLGEQIVNRLGNGDQWRVQIKYSAETSALETAGGIANALPLLGDDPFLVVNADLFTDFDFSIALKWQHRIATESLSGFCTLVPNPAHNLAGDFALDGFGLINNQGPDKLTYAGIAVFASAFFKSVSPGTAAPLAPLLRRAADARQLAGLKFSGFWSDVGSPERLNELNRHTPN